MKLSTGMILLTFILLKISQLTKALPLTDHIYDDEPPSYTRGESDNTDTYYDSSGMSGDFLDENEESVYSDYVIKRVMKPAQDEWKVNLNKTSDAYRFQGDIRLDAIQKLKIQIDEVNQEVEHIRTKRAARSKEPQLLWKDNTIYYKIDNTFSYGEKVEIKRGIRHWKKIMKNCLKFIRLKDDKQMRTISRQSFRGGPVQHILFTKTDTGCWSQVGRTDTRIPQRPFVLGQQLISIGVGCAEKGTVIHEIGHAVGFWHEQSRRDRDQYVRIIKKNILPTQLRQFKRMAIGQVGSMGYAYDFGSVMHYGPTFFSANGSPTIKVKSEYRGLDFTIGQRNALSYLDIAQVRAMYKCNTIPSQESQKTCSKSDKGRSYRGTLDYTEKGVMCQPWYKQYPHSHKFDLNNPDDGLGRHNYCRNPGGEKERPWCFTTYSENIKQDWQYCDIKSCSDS